MNPESFKALEPALPQLDVEDPPPVLSEFLRVNRVGRMKEDRRRRSGPSPTLKTLRKGALQAEAEKRLLVVVRGHQEPWLVGRLRQGEVMGAPFGPDATIELSDVESAAHGA
jgi:hypothetical protein